MLGNVDGDDVAQQPFGLVTHVLDLEAMLVSLHIPVVMKPVTDLKLPVEEPDEEQQQEEGQDGLMEQEVERTQAGIRSWVRGGLG